MAGFSSTPSNYPFLKKLRQAKKASLKPCSYLKPSTVLRDYQVIGVLHFLSLARMILGDGVGLGKTLQMITSYAYRLMSEPNLKLLVVTPKSAMAQWAEEFEKFCNGIKVHILTNEYGEVRDKGPDKKVFSTGEYGKIEDLKAKGIRHRAINGFAARKAQYETVDANVLIVNYYAIKEDYKFLIENRGPVFQVAFDECFEYHTPVLLSDGTTELIGKIVSQRKEVEVLTYNKELNIIEPKKVINFFKSTSTSWLKVKKEEHHQSFVAQIMDSILQEVRKKRKNYR